MSQCQFIDQFASHHQSLLIGQSDRLASLNGTHRRAQTGISHHSGQHHIHRASLSHFAQGISTGIHLDRQVSQSLLQLLVFGFISNHHSIWHKPARLFYQQLHPIIGCQRIRFVQIRMLSYNFQSLSTDRTC